MCLLLENVGGSEQNRSAAIVQSDDLWPSRMHAATHILQEKTHACGVLKRHNFRVHVSLGNAETLVRRGEIISHHLIAYSPSNISAKNYQNRLMWVESIVCNISVVFLGHSVWEQDGSGTHMAGAGRARESCLRERAGAGWHNLSRATL